MGPWVNINESWYYADELVAGALEREMGALAVEVDKAMQTDRRDQISQPR